MLLPAAGSARGSEVTDQHDGIAVTVDRRSGWRVIHPTGASAVGLGVGSPLIGFSAMFAAIGVFQFVTRHDIGGLFAELGIAVCPLALTYLMIFRYFVAYDQRFVAAGRRFGAPRVVVTRSEVSQAVWSSEYRKNGGRLIGRAGEVLILLEPVLSRRQLAVLARELGVPFREVSTLAEAP
jgi:hypothetical protein